MGSIASPAMLLYFVGVWRGESLELPDRRCQGRQLFRETVESSFGLGLSTAGYGEENSSCVRVAINCLRCIAVPPW